MMSETENIEYKKTLAELKGGIISIVSILNKHGAGELWFGIRNDGKCVGLDVTEKTLRDISQSFAANIEPKIYPTITKEIKDNKNCIRIVFSGSEKPYFAYGKAYMRVADEDRQLSARELETIIVNKYQNEFQWDNAVSGTSISDILEHKVKGYVEKTRLQWDNIKNVLEKLGLLKDGKPVNTAAIFFTNIPMQLRCAVFAGIDSSTIIDRHDFDGDILQLIEEAQKYILKNVNIGMRIEGLRRIDMPEIPLEAIREAVVNAFCHRDYTVPDFVQVAIFKDRVEIRNPGVLYDGLTIEQMKSGNISKRRNPLVAEMLRRIEMVEAWGSGIPFILKSVPGVDFFDIAKIFTVCFPRPSFTNEQSLQQNIIVGEQVSEQVSEQVAKILLICSEKPLEKQVILEKAGLSNVYLNYKRHILPLIEQELLERTIPDKPTSRLQKYRITQQGITLLSTLRKTH